MLCYCTMLTFGELRAACAAGAWPPARQGADRQALHRLPGRSAVLPAICSACGPRRDAATATTISVPDVPGLLAAQDAAATAKPPGARSGDGLGPLGACGEPGPARRARWASCSPAGTARSCTRNLRLGLVRGVPALLGERARQSSAASARLLSPVRRVPAAAAGDRARSHERRQPARAGAITGSSTTCSATRIARPCRRCASSATPASSPGTGGIASTAAAPAPIVTALARHYRHLDLELVAADILTCSSTSCAGASATCRYVTTVQIDPDDDAALPGQYDVIVCLETFEHLPRPLAALTHFHTALRPGGVLVFDYIRSEGAYLDTPAGLARSRARAGARAGALRGGGRRRSRSTAATWGRRSVRKRG